jgi:hypothetical protein
MRLITEMNDARHKSRKFITENSPIDIIQLWSLFKTTLTLVETKSQ